MAIIAIDLMSSTVNCAALGKTGKILELDQFSLKNLDGPSVSILIQSQIEKLIKQFENSPMKIKSVGIAVPGIYYSKSGTVWAPNIPGWHNYPLKQDMSKFLERSIIVKIASKRTCDILGEKWLGAARKSRNAIYFSVGNGIGAGVLIDGRVLHGFSDGAGAAGWMAVDKNFREEFKLKGSLEYYASANGIMNTVRALLLKNPQKSRVLSTLDIQQITINDVFKAFTLKDYVAVRVINECIAYWGMAAANLVSLFNPEIIIFGGSLFGPALEFLEKIKEQASKWAQPIFIENVKFVKSQLGAYAGLFGAGLFASKKF